jgi:hypothetical protein
MLFQVAFMALGLFWVLVSAAEVGSYEFDYSATFAKASPQ